MKIKKTISVMKAGTRLNINIPAQFVELLGLEAGSKNTRIELDTNKKILIIRQIKEQTNNER